MYKVVDLFAGAGGLSLGFMQTRKVISILNDLGLSENDDIILIDARNDNKSSASNVKIEKASE